MDDDKYFNGEFINFETELFNKTKSLVQELMKYSTSEISMIDFRCAEIFSLKNKLELFISIRYEFTHYEVTSLVTYWDSLFHEIKEVVESDDSNTSWLSSRFDNYQHQHEIVDEMFRSRFPSKP